MHVHLAAIAAAAILRAILVAVWWSPRLFLSRWMQLAGVTREAMLRGWLGGSVFAVAGSAVMATVLDIAFVQLGIHTAAEALVTAAAIWVGFVSAPMLSSVVYERKPLELFFINAGFQLAALLGMGLALVTLA